MELPDWARAHGPPLFAARLRSNPEDFEVTEELGWDFSGDGEHDFLRVEKTGANTEWVARQLARHAGVPARDVGYAGLKDRHAVTRQWFSVPRWHDPDWQALDIDGVVVLDVQRHNRKLRRGAHKANAFRIVLRGERLDAHAADIEERFAAIRERGVPNYFGEQRFGRQGTNLALANEWAAGKRLPRHARSLAISTIRSYVFNEYLDARVRDMTWNRIVVGDKANLDGTGSVFDVDELNDDISHRCETMDIHPAGELVGDDSAMANEAWVGALGKARVGKGWRSLRMPVSHAELDISSRAVSLSFSIGSGSFATSLLREIADV